LKKTVITLAFLLSVHAGPALGDPTGNYAVEGSNPGSGSPYRGAVSVRRIGDTYAVRWRVGRTVYIGTGLGATFRDGKFAIGPAKPDDNLLAVSYVSGRSFGLAFFIRRNGGEWEGIWTYGGSRRIGRETWIAR
jgi:hypothetical protein